MYANLIVMVTVFEILDDSHIQRFHMKPLVQKITNNQKGSGMVEYAMVVALVALIAMMGVGPFGWRVKNKFDDVGNEITASESIWQPCNPQNSNWPNC